MMNNPHFDIGLLERDKVRKTISFNKQLSKAIAILAQRSRRSFAGQVEYMLATHQEFQADEGQQLVDMLTRQSQENL